MKWFLVLILTLVPFMAVAQDIPDALAAQVQRNPDKYLDDLAVIIAGYGKDGAIDQQGLQNLVAMALADARAMAMRRLAGADLNGDGAIGGDEMRVKAAASSAAARGRIILYFGKADMDRDDQVSVDELQAYANLVAEQSFNAEDAAAVFAVMGFDKNDDGLVTLAEVKAAIALARSSGPGDKVDKKLKI